MPAVAELAPRLFEAIREVERSGWPAAAVFMYDESWQLLHQIWGEVSWTAS